MTDPHFFATPDEFRAWLEDHHETETELLVGFYKASTGRPSMTWSESVDQALCFGWIDGVRRGRDDVSYTIRFTPRKARSTWSRTNVAKAEDLTQKGLMRPAGIAAFQRRTEANTGVYSFERDGPVVLDPAHEQRLRDNAAAAAFFESQPPGYRNTALHWVTSAKRQETRDRRLGQLIEHSAAGRRIPQLA